MTNFNKQIFSVIAAGTMVLNLATPVLADSTIEISGNGKNSDSTVNLDQNHSTTVTQSNVANISNNVDVKSNTGGNNAKDNTGGNVKVETGDATTKVTVNNTANTNSANVDCCAAGGNTDVLISGNGKNSDNTVKLNQNNDTTLTQQNNADVKNKVNVDSNTGDNDAEDNTGGDVSIKTGDTDTTVKVGTTANANWAQIGGGSSNGGSLTARILGNGKDSDNKIELDFDNDVTLSQWNVADIENDVDVDATTGDNNANDNTGGDVMIETGDADADVTVDNMVNFNAADVDCGCLMDDVLAKISGNGKDSDNKIKANLGGATTATQGNTFDCDGHYDSCADVDVDANTGDNDANDNTGEVDTNSDPSIETGDTDSTVKVNNAGNSNAFGVDLSDLDLPNLGGLHFNFSFDLGDLLGL